MMVALTALMRKPFVPATSTLATPGPPSMVSDLAAKKAPKLPESKASTSPLTCVCKMASAKVLQGAVRGHPADPFASSPTPETQARATWPLIVQKEARSSMNVRALGLCPEGISVYLGKIQQTHFILNKHRVRDKIASNINKPHGFLYSKAQSQKLRSTKNC